MKILSYSKQDMPFYKFIKTTIITKNHEYTIYKKYNGEIQCFGETTSPKVLDAVIFFNKNSKKLKHLLRRLF